MNLEVTLRTVDDLVKFGAKIGGLLLGGEVVDEK